MDEIVGGEVSGSVPGAVVGDVKLVRGVRGQALYMNGIDQRVDLGNQRHNCMGDLSKCKNGFVMAMWLQMHKYDEPGLYTDEYYISNGGHATRSIGVALLMREKKLLAMFRTETRLWEAYYDDGVSLHTWYHVVMVWSSASGGYIYINGALGSHNQQGESWNSNQQPNTFLNFILGDANTDPPIDPGEMTLDELRIWDMAMDDQGAWKLYSTDAFP